MCQNRINPFNILFYQFLRVKAEIPFHDELAPKRDNSNPESIYNERYAKEEKEEIDHPDSNLDAWTVLKLSGKTSPGNVSEANQNFKYEELEFDGGEQLSLL